MDAPCRSSSGNINVFFSWSGPKEYFDGRLEVGNIEIKGLPNEVAVYGLPNLKHDETKPLNFKIKDKNSIFSSETATLKITVDQLNRIKIIAGVLEETAYRGPKIMDSRTGRMISPDTSTLRTESTLHFKKPASIQVGASYNIVCTHESATLVECEPARPKDAFEVFFEALIHVQNSVNISMFGWGVRLVAQFQDISKQLYLKNSREQIEHMLEKSKSFIPPKGEEKMYFQAVNMLKNFIQVYRDQEEIFRSIEDLISRGQFDDALNVIPSIDKEEKKAEAYGILIKGYIENSNNFSQERFDKILKSMPEGNQKEDILNYIDARAIRRKKFHDPAEAMLILSAMPEGDLKAQLFEEVKAAQVSHPETDIDTSLLFGNEETEQVLPPVPQMVKPKELGCIVS